MLIINRLELLEHLDAMVEILWRRAHLMDTTIRVRRHGPVQSAYLERILDSIAFTLSLLLLLLGRAYWSGRCRIRGGLDWMEGRGAHGISNGGE